jgi:hypothetical protein
MGWPGTAKWLVAPSLAVGIVVIVVLAPWAYRPASLEDVERAQGRFRASGIDSYTVWVSHDCWGCDDPRFLITVEDGELTAVDGKALRHLAPEIEWVEEWGPIDRGLESASAVAGDREFRAKISFDPDTGVPRSFSASPAALEVGDGWFNYHWSHFQRTR